MRRIGERWRERLFENTNGERKTSESELGISSGFTLARGAGASVRLRSMSNLVVELRMSVGYVHFAVVVRWDS